MTALLPIHGLRDAFEVAADAGPVVISAPTGSGKSTQVPRWLLSRGRVLVVEPRRVACRALAARVAELEGVRLGAEVGYLVRDERRASPSTRLVFATPGVALRMIPGGDIDDFATVVLDEAHERSLDVDLLLALLLTRRPRAASARCAGLVVMSATLAGDRIAEHLGGRHLAGEGRQHPVTVEHVAASAVLPDARGVESRVLEALRRDADQPGDVLVFLPGRGEIERVRTALARHPVETLVLHGSQRLSEQARVLKPRAGPGGARRVVLATNVAETSLTIPGVGAVIDSGLVRRTRYHDGRGYLTLAPVALDSADQRTGRAGRLGPGRCYRLWSPAAVLEPVTPPEIHRESLVPLVLGALACGVDAAHGLAGLPWLDRPKEHAVDRATGELRSLGGLDDALRLTDRGRRLFRLPLDPHLARLLVEAEGRDLLEQAVALAASLSTRRALFARAPEDPDDDLRPGGCDAVGGIRAVFAGRPAIHGLDGQALDEARAAARRYRQVMGMPPTPPEQPGPIDRKGLALLLMAAWPRCVHVARVRKKHVAWSHGGTELELGRETAVDERVARALIVLESRAFTLRGRKRQLVATRVMPVPLQWLVEAGLGQERLAGTRFVHGQLLAKVERVYAGRVIASWEEPPVGALARRAVRDAILEGRLLRGAVDQARDRHEALGLAARLDGRSPPIPLDAWLLARLEAVGLETADDVELLQLDDVLPEALSPERLARLDREFPRRLDLGDAIYTITYDVAARAATLHQTGGQRTSPPPAMFLPTLPGWTLKLERRNRVTTLRG